MDIMSFPVEILPNGDSDEDGFGFVSSGYDDPQQTHLTIVESLNTMHVGHSHLIETLDLKKI